MKTFIYTAEYKNAKYGFNVTVTIHQIKKNKPVNCGQVSYNTGSCMGIEHEVNRHLINNNILPKSYGKRGGYVNYDKYGEDKEYYFYSI